MSAVRRRSGHITTGASRQRPSKMASWSWTVGTVQEGAHVLRCRCCFTCRGGTMEVMMTHDAVPYSRPMRPWLPRALPFYSVLIIRVSHTCPLLPLRLPQARPYSTPLGKRCQIQLCGWHRVPAARCSFGTENIRFRLFTRARHSRCLMFASRRICQQSM